MKVSTSVLTRRLGGLVALLLLEQRLDALVLGEVAHPVLELGLEAGDGVVDRLAGQALEPVDEALRDPA